MRMKNILICFGSLLWLMGTVSLSAAEESIEDLLKTYRKEADLSKETKKENAGFVIVYTRDDLERMQVYRLSDLLKSLRFFTYDINSFGMTDPLQRNPVFYSSDMIKLYVNEHEIGSGFAGSGLLFYGNVDMGMFDHVEIYQDSPVLDVATEPAAFVVKLYTKTPERENGGSLLFRLGDRGMQEASLSHALVMDKWSYFAYAEESENYFRHDRNMGHDISRDYRQRHLYMDLHRDTHRMEFEYLGQTHDPFTAQSLWIVPDGGKWEIPMFRASYAGDWFDGSVHTDLSYIYSSIEMDLFSDSPFWGELFEPFFPESLFDRRRKHFSLKTTSDIFTAKLYHERTLWNDHQCKIGAEYRYKGAENTGYTINDLHDADRKGHFNIASFYLQDQIALFHNSMLSLSFKYNYYDFERMYRGEKDRDRLGTWQGRIAYSTIRDRWHFKTFLTHVEFPTQLFELLMHDASLDSQKFNTVSGEIKYIDESDEWRVTVSGSQAQDASIVNPTAHGDRIVNVDLNMLNSSFDFIHNFDEDHRLDFNLYWSHFDKKTGDTNRNYLGGFIRLLDTFGRWDIFNELIYRQQSPGLDPGWDYSAGAKYHVTKDFSLAFKGVNIFDSARESKFTTLRLTVPESAGAVPGFVTGSEVFPVVERQFFFTLEWLF
ncbi:hypothetical protein [Hydrogenimonas sp.]